MRANGVRPEQLRVFVVDDEALIAVALEQLLSDWGFATCGHAARALDALHAITAERPELVLMDVDLGPGMSGIDVARRLRAVYHCQFLFLTGSPLEDVQELALGLDDFGCVGKPYSPHELRSAVHAVLAGKRVQALAT